MNSRFPFARSVFTISGTSHTWYKLLDFTANLRLHAMTCRSSDVCKSIITVVSVSTLKEISWIMGNEDCFWVIFFILKLWQKIPSLVKSLTPNLRKSIYVVHIAIFCSFAGILHAHSGDLKFQEIVIYFRIRDHFRKFICELWKQLTQVELNPFVFILYLPNKVQSRNPRVQRNWARASLGGTIRQNEVIDNDNITWIG